MQASTFKEAIDNKRFLEAEDMIKRGDDILKSQFMFKLADAFPKIIQNNAFYVIDALVEHNHIELDIYEYDSFKDSVFSALASDIQDTDEAVEFLEKFMPQVDSLNDNLQDDTWLGLAFRFGAPTRIIQTMIDNGCDANYLDNNENTYLHLVCGGGMSPRLNDEKAMEYIELLISQGLDVNRPNSSGTIPLHTAVGMKKEKQVELLLQYGADPNIPDKLSTSYPMNSAHTAYHKAILQNMDFDMVQLLMNYTPIDLYVETGRKTNILYDYMKTCVFNGISEKEKQFLNFFAEQGIDLSVINEGDYGERHTVIDLVIPKNFEFFDAFTDIFEIDVNQADDQGNTILHKVCAINVNFEERKAKDIYRKVKKLLNMGAEVALRNTQDKTPADLASDDNLKEKTVALLLKQ